MISDFVLRLTNLVVLIVDHDVVVMLLLAVGGSHLLKRRKNFVGWTSSDGTQKESDSCVKSAEFGRWWESHFV